MMARTKSYVVTEIFLPVFPLELPLWHERLMFCVKCFQNKNQAAQIGSFLLGNIAVNISGKDGTEITPLFRLDTITL